MEIFSLNSGSFALITNFFFLLNLDRRESSELHSHHAVRQRCLSVLAAVSVRASVVMESAPILLDVLGSAHAGDPPSTDSFLELGSEWNAMTTSFFCCCFFKSRSWSFLRGRGGARLPELAEDSGAGSGRRGHKPMLSWRHRPMPAFSGAPSCAAKWGPEFRRRSENSEASWWNWNNYCVLQTTGHLAVVVRW